MQYRVQHGIIDMDEIHMIYNYAKTSDIKTHSIRKTTESESSWKTKRTDAFNTTFIDI